MFSRLAWFPTETLLNSMLLSMKKGMWKQLNQDEFRQRNMGTGSTREPGGQCSKHRVDSERGRDREWWWMKERERGRVTGAGWALASQTCTMIPVQEQIDQFFMACPLAASSISAFYIYFQISDCSKHSSRLKRQLRNSGLDPAHVHTQPALSHIADRRCYIC